MTNIKIFLGADHAGYDLKQKIKRRLEAWGYDTEDLGAFVLDPEDDYPEIITAVAKRVSREPEARGIIMGHSGQGEAMVAGKFPGVRAAVYYGGPEEIVKLSREHNDANILSLGAFFLDPRAAEKAVRVWLQTPFGDEPRHRRRIRKLAALDEQGRRDAANG